MVLMGATGAQFRCNLWPGKIHGDNLVIVPSNNGEVRDAAHSHEMDLKPIVARTCPQIPRFEALRMQVQEEQNLWITIAERNARPALSGLRIQFWGLEMIGEHIYGTSAAGGRARHIFIYIYIHI